MLPDENEQDSNLSSSFEIPQFYSRRKWVAAMKLSWN